MPIKISAKQDGYTAEVTPPVGQWQSPHPMEISELTKALMTTGCDKRAIRKAFDEGALEQYRLYADEAIPQVQAALAGDRDVSPQSAFTEAWLTYALYENEIGVTLHELMWRADAINKTVPTADEISWTFLCLRERNWLARREDLYGITSEGRRTIAGVVKADNVFDEVLQLEKWIVAHPAGDVG